MKNITIIKKIVIVLICMGVNLYSATIAYWDFNDGTDGLSFSDMPSSGSEDLINGYIMRGYNTTYGPTFSDDTSIGSGLSAYCNGGQDGYITDTFLNTWSPQLWTIEISVKLDSLSDWNTIIGRDGSSQNEAESDFYFQNNGVDDRFRLNYKTVGGERWILDSDFVPVTNHWYHFVLVCDGITLTMYCDKLDSNGYQVVGELDISYQTPAENALAQSGNSWTFGRGWYNGNNVDQIVGYFDNVRFSDTVLAPAEFLFYNPVIFNESDGITVLYRNDTDYSDDYTIVLAKQPSDDVIVTVVPPSGLDVGNGDGQSLDVAFSDSDWSQAKTITVKMAGSQELLSDTMVIEHTVNSNDETFVNNFVPSINVVISDDSCGIWGYLESDYDLDCMVNLVDFSVLAKLWLMTEDSLELEPFAEYWLEDTYTYNEAISGGVIKENESSYFINTANILNEIDEKVYGHFLEHIYHSVNGGLWGDMIWNRSFEMGSQSSISSWAIETGSDGEELVQTSLATDVHIEFGDINWTNYELSLQAQKNSGDEGFLVVFRAPDSSNLYWLNIGGWGNTQHAIEKEVNGGRSVLDSISGSIITDQWYDIRIRCENQIIQVWLDDTLIFAVTDDSSPYLSGNVGVGTWNTQARFRNIEVTDLSAQPAVLYSGLPDLDNLPFGADFWTKYGSADVSMSTDALNDEFSVGISGDGVSGLQQGNFKFSQQAYHGSLWMKGSLPSGIVVLLLDGETILGQSAVLVPTSSWAEYEFSIISNGESDNGSLRIQLQGAGDVYIDQVSMMSQDSIDTGGYRPDLLEAVSELRPPIIRWPGGCYASAYFWKECIGPQYEHRKYPISLWDDQDTNSYGPDEFLRMCEIIDSEPLLVVNSGVLDATCGVSIPYKLSDEQYLQDALDWMEYCNGDVTTTWGALRAENGHPEPYNVTYWEIDNETWIAGSASYAEKVLEFAPAMRAKAEELGTPIVIIVCGGNGLDMAWNEDIIDSCADVIDFISVHNYDDAGEHKSGPIAYDSFLTTLESYIASSSNPEVKIYNSEWNLQTTDWRTGLYAGGILNVFERHGGEFKIGGPALFLRHTSATGWDNAFINFDHTGWFAAPNYIIMKLWWDHFGPYLVETEADDDYLNVNSVLSEDHKTLYVRLVNPDETARSVELEVDNTFVVESAYMDYVSPGDLYARNTLEETDAVRVQSKLVGQDSQTIRFNMPGYSAGIVTISTTELHKTKFLYSYFQGNGDGLHLAYSEDGMTFTALNNDVPYITPSVGGNLMRDPSICQGPDGMFHMVWTTGWWDDGIGIAHSADMVNWSEQTYLPVMAHESNALNCWAPEIFYDEVTNKYLIFWATTIDGEFQETYNPDDDNNHRIYYVSTDDFATYTDTALFYDPGFNVIDAFITKDDDRYVMVVKDETKAPVAAKNFHLAFSDNAAGPYGSASASISPSGLWVEGPSMIKVGKEWIIYFDAYSNGYMGALASDDMVIWTNISSQVSFPSGTRHGTVFRVTSDILDNLLN